MEEQQASELSLPVLPSGDIRSPPSVSVTHDSPEVDTMNEPTSLLPVDQSAAPTKTTIEECVVNFF